MIELCVIGNSHSATLRDGWTRVRNRYPHMQVHFFANLSRYVDNWNVSGDRLVFAENWPGQLKTSGDSSLGISNKFEGYIVCGFHFGFYSVEQDMCRWFRVDGASTDRRWPISRDCLSFALYCGLRDSGAVRLIRKLRQITVSPIILFPTPMRSEASSIHTANRIRSDGSEQILADAFRDAASQVSAELGFELYMQPADTLASPLFTKTEFSDAREGDENVHANASYGAHVWRDFFSVSPVAQGWRKATVDHEKIGNSAKNCGLGAVPN